jgi:hypothetical protein
MLPGTARKSCAGDRNHSSGSDRHSQYDGLIFDGVLTPEKAGFDAALLRCNRGLPNYWAQGCFARQADSELTISDQDGPAFNLSHGWEGFGWPFAGS